MSPVTAADYMRKARRALASAHLMLEEADPEGACNRAYYAMFNAAHAALWAAGRLQPGTVIKTHSGLIAVFGQELVKNGSMDAAHGRALGHVQKLRAMADYTADPPTEAREAVALAEAFVEAVQARFMDEQS